MSIFKRGKIYWYHFYFNSQHVQESSRQGNPKVARQIEAAHRTALAKGEAGFRERKPIPTVANFCTDRVEPWAKSMFEKTSPNTWRWYRSGLRSIQNYLPVAALSLDRVTGEVAAGFAAHRQSENLEVASVNASLRILRRVLNLALEWGVISAAPKVRLLRGERHREIVVSQEQEAKYLAAAAEPLASLAIVLADTGMRPDEAYRLRWENIVFSDGRHGTLLITHGKTAAARRQLPLTARVRTTLEGRWETLKRPVEGWVWPAPTKSGHIDHSSVKKQHARVFRVINEDSGKKGIPVLQRFVLYAFRHTFLTRLAANGCDPWTLARIAGWSDISISKRYVHPSRETVLTALSRVPEALASQEAENGSVSGSAASRRIVATPN